MATPNLLEPKASARKPTWERLRQILATRMTIAVVGISDKADRPNHTVLTYLRQPGYRINPVNPTLTQALGEKAYARVRDIREPVDAVQIFRPSESVPPIVEDAIANRAKVVWMQLGIINEVAAAASLKVVMDTCMGAAHRPLRARGEI